MFRILLLTTVILFSTNCFSQKRITLDQNAIDTLRFVNENFKYENAILQAIQNDETIVGWTKYYTFKSFRCLVERKKDSSKLYAVQAISVFNEKEFNDKAAGGLIHKAYYLKGLRAFFEKKYMSAITSFNEGLRYIEKYPHSYDGKSWKSYIYSFLSNSHYNLGDLKLALRYKKEKLKDYRMKFKFFGSLAYLDIGNLYAHLGNLDSAKVYNHKALAVYNSDAEHTGDESYESLYMNKVGIYSNLGAYHYQEEHIDSATIYFKKAHNEFLSKNLDYTKKGKSNIKFFMKANHAFVLYKEGQLKKAEGILLSVLDSINPSDYSRDNKRLYLRLQDYLTKVYQGINKEHRAIALNRRVLKYLDDYGEVNTAKQLQLLSMEFDTELKENQIKSLSQEKSEQKLIIENYQIIAIALIAVLLLAAAFFVYYRKVKRQQNEYEKINLQQRLMLMQMNPHFIFNAFNAINGKIVSGSENTLTYVQKLSYLFRSILRNSSEEYVTLKDELEFLSNYLEVQSDFLEKFDFNIKVHKDLNQEMLLIPPMLIQPLLENSIVHGIVAEKGLINLDINVSHSDPKVLIVEVYDNGKGFNQQNANASGIEKESFSTKLIKERLRILSKKFKSNFQLDYLNVSQGVHARLILPVILDE
ncbi:histidine kinase [Winogradskyella sp.]|uniref:histidine kinase n=1 Tax=Winogradskyella sp. TaxID=1883156 RepID=UPI003BAD9720